jgi:hypothetical protein
MKLFILTRILDVLTTLLNTNKYGASVEGNPLMEQIMIRGLFIPYQIFMTGMFILLAEAVPKYKKISYFSMSLLSLFFILSNLFCYLFI